MLKIFARKLYLNRRPILVTEALLVALLLLGWGATSFPSYQQCIIKYEQAPNDDNKPYANKILPRLFICEGVAAEANNGIITAVATVFMAWFTGILWFVTSKAVTLARDEFVATHRPRMVLQRIDLFNHRRLQIVIANAGETPAFVTDWHARVYYRDNQSAFWPEGDGPPEIVTANFWIEAGEPKTITVGAVPESMGRDQFMVGEADMFVVGLINYSGRDKISRSTGFCRKWFKGDGSWRVQRHSEYEYQY